MDKTAMSMSKRMIALINEKSDEIVRLRDALMHIQHIAKGPLPWSAKDARAARIDIYNIASTATQK